MRAGALKRSTEKYPHRSEQSSMRLRSRESSHRSIDEADVEEEEEEEETSAAVIRSPRM